MKTSNWTEKLTHSRMRELLRASSGAEPTGMILFGIRVALSNGVRQVDRWVDLLGYWTPTEFKYYEGTTRPGLDALHRPINPAGTAIMVPGYYRRLYVRGRHGVSGGRPGHEAFRQVGNVRFWRDNDRDSEWDVNSPIQTSNLTCLNFHSAPERGGGVAARVGMHSAGCQVVRRMSSLAEITAKADDSGQKFFDYALLDLDLNKL